MTKKQIKARADPRRCDDCSDARDKRKMIGRWHLPFSTREPYPSWYRRLPIVMFMPWRNPGCLGFKMFGIYIDFYRTWHFPWFGCFVHAWRWRGYPLTWRMDATRLRRHTINGWCSLWCWLQDHTGTGHVNRVVVAVAEKVTPADW